MRVDDALRLAVDHLESTDELPAEPYRVTASPDGGRWVFWFQALPETPGRDVTAFVDEAGDVTTLRGI